MKCVTCKADIPEEAQICSVCSNYQIWWKNSLVFLGKTAGFLTILVAVGTYAISSVLDLRVRLFPEDKITLLAFRSSPKENVIFTLRNSGDRPVFISHVRIHGEHEYAAPGSTVHSSYNEVRPINEHVQVGDFLVNKSTHVYASTHPINPVSGVTDEQWSALLDLRAAGGKSSPSGAECLSLEFYSANDPNLVFHKDTIGPTLRTLSAKGTIYFYSTEIGNQKTLEFPVEGVLMLHVTDPCLRLIKSVLVKGLQSSE